MIEDVEILFRWMLDRGFFIQIHNFQIMNYNKNLNYNKEG